MACIILVVDDEAPVADVIRMLVEDLGHRVFTAADGVAALELVEKERPRLVISDIMMPRMAGDELCRRIKGTPGYRSVKVVLMSAAGARRAEETGADAFVHRPFEFETIEELVERFVP